MEQIKRISKKKHYKIEFFDMEVLPCGTVEDATLLENMYDVCRFAYEICNKVPKHVVVTNLDGTESSTWHLSLSTFKE